MRGVGNKNAVCNIDTSPCDTESFLTQETGISHFALTKTKDDIEMKLMKGWDGEGSIRVRDRSGV